jgi:hypothetical protein
MNENDLTHGPGDSLRRYRETSEPRGNFLSHVSTKPSEICPIGQSISARFAPGHARTRPPDHRDQTGWSFRIHEETLPLVTLPQRGRGSPGHPYYIFKAG